MGNSTSSQSSSKYAADTHSPDQHKGPIHFPTDAVRHQEQTNDQIWNAARGPAQKEWEGMKSSYEASQKAFKSGDRAKAKALSLKGAAHKAQAEKLEGKASEEIFTKLNHGRPPTEIDLHGQKVDAALKLVEKHMKLWRQKGVRTAVIIVGRGNHSADGAKIKYEVKAQLEKQRDVRLSFEVPNAGCITVEFVSAAAPAIAAAAGDQTAAPAGLFKKLGGLLRRIFKC